MVSSDVLCVFPILILLTYQVLSQITEAQETIREIYPFNVYISGEEWACSGALISREYVICPAYCVNGSRKATVYLGFSGFPNYKLNFQEPKTQVVRSNEIIIHEDYTKVKKDRYLNNIALLKLSIPGKLGRKLRPGILASDEDGNQHLIGKLVNISGYKERTNLSIASLRLLSHDTCRMAYNGNSISQKEFCGKWDDNEHSMTLMGNLASVDDTIIGFITNSPPNKYSMILNIAPFLSWISWQTNIDKAKLTGDEQKERKRIKNIEIMQENIIQKLEALTDFFAGSKMIQPNINGKRVERTNLDDVIQRVTNLGDIIEKSRIDQLRLEQAIRRIERLLNRDHD